MRSRCSLTQGIRLAPNSERLAMSEQSESKRLAMSERSESNGPRRDRTADLYNAIVALSQLSYGPVQAEIVNSERSPSKHARRVPSELPAEGKL